MMDNIMGLALSEFFCVGKKHTAIFLGFEIGPIFDPRVQFCGTVWSPSLFL